VGNHGASQAVICFQFLKRITAQGIKEESVMLRHIAQRLVVAVAALALLLGVPSIWAAENVGTVRGIVKSSSGQPLSGAYVKVFNPDRDLTFMVVSQAGGRFTFENLPPGKYAVQGIGGNFQSPEVPVDVGSGGEVEANVSLSEARAPQLPNSWPFRKGDVNGNEEWDHQPQMQMVPGAGRDALEAKCEQCHNTTRIALLPQSRAKWAMTVATMRNYITAGHLQPISDHEAVEITDYLAKYYSGLPGSANELAPVNSRLPRTLAKGASARYFAMDMKLPEDPNRDPHDLTVDYKGNAWMADRLGCCVVKLDPKTYKVTVFTPPPAAQTSRLGGSIQRNDSATTLWVQDNANRRWLNLDTRSGKFTSYPIPSSITGPVGSNFMVITKDGRIWGATGQAVLGLNPKDGKFVAYPIPYYQKTGKSAVGYGMAISGDGKIWFAERDPSLLGRLDPSTGKIDEFETPIPGSIPRRMGADRAGNIWVGLHGAGKLLKVDFETTKMTLYTPPTSDNGLYIAILGAKGMIWVSEQTADKIAMFDPKTAHFTEYALPTSQSDARRITTDPTNPNRIWWSGDTSERVGYIQVER
jgi:virginiamycin B lyase